MALTRITTGTISANSISAEKVQNASIQARHFQTGTITLDLIEANANVAAAEIRLNANLDIVQDNVASNRDSINIVQSNLVLAEANVELVSANHIAFATYANTNLDTKANVSATFIQLDANLDATSTNVGAVIANADAFGAYANTNLDTKANVSATYFLALANDYATYTQLNANLNIVQDNVASILDGTSQFTGPVTMQDALTVQGNLIVVGAQVDLGVGSAQIDDAVLTLAANTPVSEGLAVDSGVLINRGANDNVFFGFAAYGSHIDFIFTDAPAGNVNHYPIAYIDVHANSFGTEGVHDATFTAFHHADYPTTGIYMPAGQETIKFAAGGVDVASVTSSGNLYLYTGIIHASPSTANTLDLDDDELGDRQNSITLRSLQSFGIFIDSNDSEDNNFFNIYDGEDDPNAVGKDDGIFSVRDTGEVFITDDISVQGNANIVLDAVVSNAVIGTRVFEGTVGLQANDSATLFTAYANDYATYTLLNANLDVITDNLVTAQTVAHANDFVTYTRLNANVNAVQSNLSTAHTDLSSNINTVQNNVAAITGGGTFLSPFVNTNTATGTSNVFFLGRDTASYSNILTVTLDGVFQANTEYVANFSNDTIQFTDATIPSGTIVTTFVMT